MLRFEPAWVFASFLLLGVACVSPAVNFGDSGELIASAATLSIAHAPGYPLFALLGRAVGTLLPLGTWAYRVNVASVLCSAAALALFWDALRRSGRGRWGAAAGVSALGVSSIWLHTSLQAEVFALNSVLAAGCFWVFCRFPEKLYSARPMAALGLLLGLGGANHHTLILIVPALLGAGFWAQRPSARSSLRGLGYLLLFGLLGLCVYLYLPIRANKFPLLDWGHPVDLGSFFHVLLRRDYGSFSLTVEGAQGGRLSGIYSQAMRFMGVLWKEFGFAASLLILLGLGVWAKGVLREKGRAQIIGAAALIWTLCAGPLFLCLGNPPLDAQTSGALGRFFLLPMLGAAWFAAYGTDRLEQWGRGMCVSAVVLIWAGMVFQLSSSAWNQRWDLAAHDYGRNVLRSLPPGSALFMDGGDDTFYTTANNLFAEGLRRDVTPHDRGGLVFPNPYGSDFRRIPKQVKEARRIEVEERYARERPTFYSTLRESILPGEKLGHWGLLKRADMRIAAPGLWEMYVRRHDPAMARAHYRYRALVPIYDALRAEVDLENKNFDAAFLRLKSLLETGHDARWARSFASQKLQWTGFDASQNKDWALAERAYVLAVRTVPEDLNVLLNLGVAYERQAKMTDAEAVYRAGLQLAPQSFKAYYNLGSLYWKKESWREAAEMFEKASALEPNNPALKSYASRAKSRAAAGP